MTAYFKRFLKKMQLFLLVFFLICPWQIKAVVPNDPMIDSQLYLNQVSAFAAWDITTGDDVVVAVIDSGVYIDHPDLKDNIWTNVDETPNDGIDNDENGYIDDYNGWDFVNDSPDPNSKIVSNYSKDGISHGTFVSGIIAAVGNNNIGISGINWHAKIMPLMVLGGEGYGNFENIAEAIHYAIDNGADVINLSLVSLAYTNVLDEAINDAYQSGLIIAAAAGNDAYLIEGVDGGFDLGYLPFYPACHDGEDNNVLGVVSVDNNDVKSIFSNYGTECVDLAAPGENFVGLNYYNPLYPEYRELYLKNWSGTSMAAPIISGAAALIKSYDPDLTNSEIYELLISYSDNIDENNPLHEGELGKRINILNVLEGTKELLSTSNRKIVVAPTSGYLPLIGVYDLDGKKLNEFYAYNLNFKGGVNLASGNVINDYQEELITSPGSGGGPHIRIFNKAGDVLSQFFAYEASYNGGVETATIKYNSDTQAKIVTVPQGDYQPLVRIFNYQGNLIDEFLAFEEDKSTGLTVTTGDINNDGVEEIIAARKNVFGSIRIFNQQGNLLFEFEPFNTSISGINITFTESSVGQPAIAISPKNENSRIKLFDYYGNPITSFDVYQGVQGLNLTSSDLDLDGFQDIIISASLNQTPEIKVYSPTGNQNINLEIFLDGYYSDLNISTINW